MKQAHTQLANSHRFQMINGMCVDTQMPEKTRRAQEKYDEEMRRRAAATPVKGFSMPSQHDLESS